MSDPMTTAFTQTVFPVRTNEGLTMLPHEALARSRMHELQQLAREHQLARSITAGSRWEWLARFASRRAERARRGAVRPAARFA
jgi:hypothetical protein